MGGLGMYALYAWGCEFIDDMAAGAYVAWQLMK